MDEVEALKRDKNVLMLELVRLRQQQQVILVQCSVSCDMVRHAVNCCLSTCL